MNSLATVPCFYHPTTVIIVDDEPEFLKSMARLLNSIDPHIIVKTFANPDQALQYINSVKNLSMTISRIFTSDAHLSFSGKAPLEFDISDIYKQATNPALFDAVSVAVVDYNMSNHITGKDFCASIAGTHIKKIMLTGAGDTTLGINLLNSRTIDQFLIKTQPDLEEKLAQSIVEMKKIYFQDLSAPILNNLSTDMCLCLSDPTFVNLFNGICSDLGIVSYYLIDFSGSFLLVDGQGKISWLIVKTQEDVDDYVDFIRDAEVAENMVSVIERGEKIPYFYLQKDYIYSIDPSFPLERHLYPAKKLVGETEYYYCLTNDVHDFPLKKGIIFSG